MERKVVLKDTFKVESKHSAFYTGGVVQWLSNGSRIFCQCGPTVNVVNVANGRVVTKIGRMKGGDKADDIMTFTLSADELLVVTAHKSGLFKLWQWVDNSLKKTWRSNHTGPVTRLALRGPILASGGIDARVRLWNISQRTCTQTLLGLSGVVSVLEFRPSVEGLEDTIFGAADDCVICSWNVNTGENIAKLTGHYSRVMALVFARDGVHLVSASRDRVLILWDLNKNVSLRTLPTYESIEGLVLLPPRFKLPGIDDDIKTGINVASAGSNGVIRVWDMLTSKELYTQQNSMVIKATEEGNLAITQLLFCEKVAKFAVIAVDHNIFLHPLNTFNCEKQLIGFSDEILDLALLGKNESHLAVASNSNDIRLYTLKSMNCRLLQGHTNLVLGLSSTPADPHMLVSCSKDHSVRVWLMDPATGGASCVGVAVGHSASVGSVAFARLSAGKFVSVSEDSCLKMWKWDAAKGAEVVHTVVAHTSPINTVAFAGNDRMLATGSQDKTAKLWSGDKLALMGSLRGHRRGVWSVAFAPFERKILTGSADTTLRIWSLTNLACLTTLQGHDGSVLRGVYISNGYQVLSASGDGLIKLWTVATAECVQTLNHHDTKVWAMLVTHDDSQIISGGSDSRLVLWRDVTVEEKNTKNEAERLMVEQEQLLSNLIKHDKLQDALKMALKLDRPLKALFVIRELLKSEDPKRLHMIVASFRNDQKLALLSYATSWNTNSRHCHLAQTVLSVLMDDLSLGTLPVLAKTVEDALPYTDRHFKRVTRLLQDVNLLEYTVYLGKPTLVQQKLLVQKKPTAEEIKVKRMNLKLAQNRLLQKRKTFAVVNTRIRKKFGRSKPRAKIIAGSEGHTRGDLKLPTWKLKARAKKITGPEIPGKIKSPGRKIKARAKKITGTEIPGKVKSPGRKIKARAKKITGPESRTTGKMKSPGQKKKPGAKKSRPVAKTTPGQKQIAGSAKPAGLKRNKKRKA